MLEDNSGIACRVDCDGAGAGDGEEGQQVTYWRIEEMGERASDAVL